MSLRHVLYVLNDDRFAFLKGSPRLLLVALAACASDRGNVCWPSEKWLVRATGMSRATLYRSKTPLREIIEIDPPGYKRSNCYYFPPVDVKGRRITEAGKVLAAKREQEMEARGELEATYGAAGSDAEVVNMPPSPPVDKSQNETVDNSECRLTCLKMRRLPSQIETGGGLKLRPEIKDESKKKSLLHLGSQIETSQNETVVDNYDGSRPPTRQEHYAWIIRHCHAAGMDEEHTKLFFAQHRPYKWTAITAATNVCDLIADYIVRWKNTAPQEYAYVQQLIRDERRQAEIRELERKVREEDGNG